MKRRKIILFLTVMLVVLGLWWLLRSPQMEPNIRTDEHVSSGAVTSSVPALSPSSSGDGQQKKAVIDKVVQAYRTPIAFYGRVVDQYGKPVVGANVTFAPIYSLLSNKTSYTGASDERGYFSIENIKGIALSVGVRKEGYYFIDDKSNATFAYGIGTDAYRKSPPTKDNPAIFVLHKMGETEPLIPISSRTYRVPRNGTPVEINLTNGKVVPAGSGNLRVEVWTDDQSSSKNKGYQWRCKITVPHGGLIERNDQFDFEAPADGYEECVELGMPANAEQWAPEQQRDYFVKLPDGHFARINFRMIAQGEHFFRLESFLNPTPGSRNLECDPVKRITDG